MPAVRKGYENMDKKLMLDGVFSSGMVLQREREIKLWGRCTEGAEIKAFLNGESCAVECSGERFTVMLSPQQASADNSVVIECGNEKTVLDDVCFGDVFLLSGQSNMQLEVARVMDVSGETVKAADYPLIRHFVVEPRYMFGRQAEDIVANPWKKAVYPDVLGFSAAGFFFARRLQAEINVPIGLVLNAMGGASIEAWMPEESLAQFDIPVEKMEPCTVEAWMPENIMEQYASSVERIIPYYNHEVFENKIREDEAENARWHEAMLKEGEEKTAASIPADTKAYNVPSMSFGTCIDGHIGSVWFYREVELNSEPQGEGLLYLGDIVDSDRTYINGTLVGETAYRYPPRKYKVPSDLLRKGKNLIASRVIFNNCAGGFVPDHPYYLDTGSEKIDLSGEWRVRTETKTVPAPSVLFPPHLPTGLYNASLYPLRNMQFTGVLWYQGETNAGAPERYCEKFTTMMNEWRRLLDQRLPIVCVELCDYTDPAAPDTDQTGWKEIQRQQREQPQHTADCAVALAADLGESLELHPQRKEELGERIAEQMLRLVYGK